MQKTLKEELIEKREKGAFEKVRAASAGKLLAFFTREQMKIKKEKSNIPKKDRVWLFENYYLIERSCRELMKLNGREYSRLLTYTDVFARLGTTASAEDFSMLFEVLCHRDFLSDRELSFIRPALIYSELSEIKRRLENGENIGEKIELLRQTLQFDFSPLVTGFSPSERYLRCDPTGVWQKMSRASRELYKRKIQQMAKKEGVSFCDMCSKLSEKASSENKHIGEYIDFTSRTAVFFYPLFAAVFILFLLVCARLVYTSSLVFVSFICLSLLVLPVFETSHRVVSFLFSLFKKGEILPSIELEQIGEENSTLVTIPSLVSSKEEVEKLFSHLELLYLKSRVQERDRVVFSLLLDFPESLKKHSDIDREFIDTAQKCLASLRQKHGERFVFFTRERVFNKASGTYGGYERKRGALMELARFVTGRRSHLEQHGVAPSHFSYVLTLDSDTNMGFSDLYKIIGTAAHPLNHPVISEQNGVLRVVKGYGIFQPPTHPSLTAAFSTPFSLLISGAGGFDSYHGPAFDLHNTLHSRALFCGKGIFHAETYVRVLEDAFPDGIVLSHDMLEGARLRCGFLSDIVFTDDVPKNALSYYKRAHRWARGDIQSLIFTTPKVFDKNARVVKNPMPCGDRFVFLFNFLLLLSPVFSFLAIFLSMSLTPRSAAVFFIATSPLWIYSLIQLFFSFIHLSFTGLYRRFFTEALTGIRREFIHFAYSICALFFRAWKNFDALCRSFWRLAISKKKLLEWTTASDVEITGIKKDTLLFWFVNTLPSFVAGIVFLIFATDPWARLTGLLWCLFFLVGYLSSKKRRKGKQIGALEREKLIEYARKSWLFFDVTVDAQNNFLPCDNVIIQPQHIIAHRTSPTNIGLYLTSLLAARDFGFIDTPTLVSRLKKTVTSVEKLPKYKGQLYNWYDTYDMTVVGEEYISSVDSGNFIVCLVALAEGLEEYRGESAEIESLIYRIRKLENEADFKFLYDSRRKLFSLGYNVQKGERESGCYDLYMSEMRTTDYYALSRGIVPKEHWEALSRPLIQRGALIGMASWSGTAFEYFMPHLFLPVFENSFPDEALSFAFAEQAQYSSLGVFGTSESGYFAFDRDMNYQYRAFGVPSLSLRRERERENVISPYSTFLMLSKNVSLCLKNLSRLERLGMCGEWGFYEALDFNPERTGGGYAMVKSYMAHHVGMSIVAIANTVFDMPFVSRFMRRGEMRAAEELLQERIPVDALVLKKSVHREEETKTAPRFALPDGQVLCRDFERSAPALLVGREINMLLSERGVISLTHLSLSLIRPHPYSSKLSFLPFGLCAGEEISTLQNGKTRFLYGKGFAQYQSDAGTVMINLSSSAPAVKARVLLKRDRRDRQSFVGIYVEPSLVQLSAFYSHPAYCDLFFEAFWDEEAHALFLENKKGSGEVVCLLSNREIECETSRERVFSGKEAGKEALFSYVKAEKPFSFPLKNPLSPCILARCRDRKIRDAVFVLGFGKTRAEAYRASSLELEKSQHKSFSDSDAYEVRLKRASGIAESDTALSEGILNRVILSRRANKLPLKPQCYGRKKLWEKGISGDLPIVPVSASLPEKALSRLLSLHKFHYISGFLYDLVFICHDSGYKREEHDALSILIDAKKCRFMENMSAGIFVLGGEWEEILSSFGVIKSEEELEKIFPSPQNIHLEKIMFAKREGFSNAGPKDIRIADGAYVPKVLWHHLIASNSFGTLLSSRSLGHTWVYNAALSKITFWENDRVGGASSEKLFLTMGHKTCDLCAEASQVIFRAGEAIFESDGYEVRVSIHPKRLFKQVRVRFFLDANIKVTYKANFVMGDGVCEASGISCWEKEHGILFTSPFSEGFQKGFGYLVYTGKEKCTACSDGVTVEMQASRGDEAVFLLGYARSEKHFEHIFKHPLSSDFVEKESREFAESFLKSEVKTGLGEAVDDLYNYRLPLQCALSRFCARTGPYQSGGAWGARDQAQDALFLIDRARDMVKSHIFRLCAHQFVEGDVFHWWHGNRGTRTRCSDDYLWLVLLICAYVEKTGDESILDVKVRYLSAPPLSKNERERYDEARDSELRESVWEHAKRALDLLVERGVGSHGLLPMGSGDWNDGMNSVGDNGGESVWLGFFAMIVFHKAYPILEKKGIDTSIYRDFCDALYENTEKNAFFTDRYARAFLSDGTPLGVEGCEACELDGLVQAFSSIHYHVTGRGNPARISAAIDTAYRLLYDGKNRIFKLFTPAFKTPDQRIGYVTSYPEGVRENGGQYTHAAVWSALSYLWAPGEKKKNYKRALDVLSCILPCERDEDIYKVEPYVLAADIYSNPEHCGRGGWSFYTGSAGWCMGLIEEIMNCEE